MARRRALFVLLVAAALALSTQGASAAGQSRTPVATPFIERAPTVADGLITSLILSVRDRVTFVYRAIRPSRIGTGYHTDAITDGPNGVDPLGAKSGTGVHRTDVTRRN